MTPDARHLPVVAHGDVARGTDLVACPIARGRLPARACAARHVERDRGSHRHPGERFPAARFPACARCSLGGVAQRRLGIAGTPGRQPMPAHGYLFDGEAIPVRVVDLRPRRVLPDDLPDVPRVAPVDHPQRATLWSWLRELGHTPERWVPEAPIAYAPVTIPRQLAPAVAEGREAYTDAARRLGVAREALRRRALYAEHELAEGLTPREWDALAVGLRGVGR